MNPVKQRGFTLVEMLVVIAIISLLAALLMPSLRLALETARATFCAGNQRQCYLAANLYAGDNMGIFPAMFKTSGGNNVYWTLYVRGNQSLFAAGDGSPYLESSRELLCPQNAMFSMEMAAGNKDGTGNPSAYGYGLFRFTAGETTSMNESFGKQINFTAGSRPFIVQYYLNRVRRPSSVTMFADSTAPKSTGAWSVGNISGTTSAISDTGRVLLQHTDMANVLHFDGHLQMLDAIGLNTLPNSVKSLYYKEGDSVTLINLP